jgi:recombination protein RecA
MPRKAKNDITEEVNVSTSQKERDKYINSLKKQNMLGDINRKIDFISTGSWVLNRLIGDGDNNNKPGGIPRGFITEICGEEASGKTTIALHTARQVLLNKETVVYADFEHSLRLQQKYVKNLDIDTDSNNFIHIIPDNLQDGVKAIGNSLVMVRPALIIIDSIAAMIPKEVIESDADNIPAIGKHARQVGSFINWIGKKLQRYNCALIVINQFRSNIKASQYDPGPTVITTGGKALQYFIGLKIKLKKMTGRDAKEEITEKSLITGVSEKKCISQGVKAIIEKNKLDIPWKSGPLYIVFGSGINNMISLILLGINLKVIKQSGAYYSWKDPSDKYSVNASGKQALRKYFIETPQALEVLKSTLLITRDDTEMEQTMIELESLGVENLNEEQKEQLKEIRELKELPTDDIELTKDELKDLEELDNIVEK